MSVPPLPAATEVSTLTPPLSDLSIGGSRRVSRKSFSDITTMSLDMIEPSSAAEAAGSDPMAAAAHGDSAPVKAAYVDGTSRESSLTLPDIGTLRINADGRTNSGATDSSQGAPEKGEEEVESSATGVPLTYGWTGTPVASKSQPVQPSAPPAPVPEPSPKPRGKSGCGLMSLLFGCGGGSGSKSPAAASQPPVKAAECSSSGARKRGTSAADGSKAVHSGGRSSRKESDARRSHSRSRESRGTRHSEGASASASASRRSKHRSRDGHRRERSPSVASVGGSSHYDADSSRHNGGYGHALDAHLTRERYFFFLVLRPGAAFVYCTWI